MSPARWIPGSRAWRRRRSYDLCERAIERVQELVDGELPPCRDSERLIAHLESCPPCALEAEAVRELKRAIHRVGQESDPEVKARLTEWARRLPDEP